MIKFKNGFAQESGDVLVYFYALDSGDYCGSGVVYISAGCGLAPGQVLDPPPGVAPGHAAQWAEGAWCKVEDSRGTVYQTSDGAAVLHDQLGPLPSHLTRIPPPTPNHRWKGDCWSFDADLEQQGRNALAVDLMRQVDITANSARERLCGGHLLAAEYQTATAEAQAFRENGYPEGAVPRSVAAGVTPSKTAQQAADEILAASAYSTEGLYKIREIRLKAKSQIRELTANSLTDQAQAVVQEAIAALEGLRASQIDIDKK